MNKDNLKTKVRLSVRRFSFETIRKISFKKPKTVTGEEKTKKSSTKINIFQRLNSPRLSTKDQTFFAKRLSFLMNAGVPILESLHMIREQTRSKSYARVLDKLIVSISNGQSLSSGLSKFKRMFGNFAINIIRVGESTGILSENLEYLADELKKKQALHKKVVGAFVYPVIVTIATLGITSFLMVYLFPKIMPIFTSLHYDLPITTKIVIWISNFLRNDGLYLLGGIALFLIALYIAVKKSPTFRFYFHKTVLRIPIVGKIIQYYNLANCMRTMGLLLKSGISISEALPITADSIENLVYQREFHHLEKTVSRGEKLSSHIRKHRDLFPDVMTQIIAVGERSGDLQNSLMYLSDFYEAEVEDFTKNLSNVIEPILMIFMGIMVGFIAISIITPIYGITQHLSPK
jgi:type IV pilus assembly protein PilC